MIGKNHSLSINFTTHLEAGVLVPVSASAAGTCGGGSMPVVAMKSFVDNMMNFALLKII